MPAYEPPSYLSPSGAEDLARCPARYELSHLQRLSTPGYISPLVLGTACHAACRALREGVPIEVALALGMEIINRKAQRFDDAARTQAGHDLVKMNVMIQGYNKHLQTLVTDLSEIPLTAPIKDGSKIVGWAMGYADWLYFDHVVEQGVNADPNPPLYVGELKTTSETVKEVEAVLRAGLQVPFYLYAAELQGLNPSGAICDIIKKPTIKQRKTETIQEYGARCLEAYDADPERYFRRVTIDYDEAEVARAMDNYVHLFKVQRHCLDIGFAAIPGPGCKGPFGWCRYRPLCWWNRIDDYVGRD